MKLSSLQGLSDQKSASFINGLLSQFVTEELKKKVFDSYQTLFFFAYHYLKKMIIDIIVNKKPDRFA